MGGQRDIGLRVGVGRDPLFVAIAGVLAANDLTRVDRQHRVEDLLPLGHQRLRVERVRRLHRDEAEDLEEVGDDHVPEGARLLVEAGPHPDPEGLGDVDLDVADVVPVPDRLVHPVGEPHREEVLDRVPPEVVVDAEDLLLLERPVQQLVQRPRRGEVGPERLLEDDPGAGSEALMPRGPRSPRRVRSAAARGSGATAALRRPPRRRCGPRLPSASKPSPRWAAPQHRGESLPRLGRDRSVTALVHRLADEGGELLVLHLPPGDADDDEALRHQSRIREVEYSREELSPREVAGRSEEDDHVILGDRRRRGDHGRLCGLDAHCRQSDVVPARRSRLRPVKVTLKKPSG